MADFLEKLKATPDGDGNLLDHAVLHWGGMSNCNAHDRNNPPAVMVGGANGRIHARERGRAAAEWLVALSSVGVPLVD